MSEQTTAIDLVATSADHVVMIVDGALDVRSKNNISRPILYTDLVSFFGAGTGYKLTLLYDVSAMWDSIDERFVLWAMDRESGGPQLQTYFAAAVSKTADPTEGWNFMVVNTSTPYTVCVSILVCQIQRFYFHSINDSPTLGFSGTHIYVTDLIVSISNKTSSGFLGNTDPAAVNGEHSLWAFPKRIPGGVGVYDGDVLPAQESLHYERFDLARSLAGGNFGAIPVRPAPGHKSTTNGTWLVHVDVSSIYLWLADNITSGAG